MGETRGAFSAPRFAAGGAVCIAGLFGIYPPGFVAQVVAFAFGLASVLGPFGSLRCQPGSPRLSWGCLLLPFFCGSSGCSWPRRVCLAYVRAQTTPVQIIP